MTGLSTVALLKTEGQLSIYPQVKPFRLMIIASYYFEGNSVLLRPVQCDKICFFFIISKFSEDLCRDCATF